MTSHIYTVPSRLVEDAADLAYWHETLDGQLVWSGIPADGPRAADSAAARRELLLDMHAELARDAWRLCGELPPLMLALGVAAVELCVHKYTGATDLLIGTAVHESQPELAQLTTVLPLRCTLEPSTPARQFLEAVRNTIRLAFVHQKVSFDRILELLDSSAAKAHAPIDLAVTMEGVNSAAIVEHAGAAVVVELRRAPPALSVRVSYDSRAFRGATIRRFADDIQTCLQFVLERPESPASTLNLVTEEEHDWLTRTPAMTPTDASTTVTTLVEERARKDADAIAAAAGTVHLTFARLDAMAEALAAELAAAGVARGSIVAVCVDHSERLPIALLAVLKAGAAYLPIDPRHPAERIARIVSDAGATVVVTEAALAAGLAAPGAQRVFVEAAARRARRQRPAPPASADALAYVIYTSGSTGVPKGACITHGALLNYVRWASDVYLTGQRINFAVCSSIAFDLTVTSIFLPLVSGGCMHLFPIGSRVWPADAILTHGAIDALKLTPSHLALLAAAARRRSSVRLMIVGGENLETEVALAALGRAAPGAIIYNEYGPTEATVGCMIHRFDPTTDVRTSVPIGVAAPNCQVLVLDGAGQLTPVNGIGELFIAGTQLAAGYLNRPEQTASRFVEHPFVAGARAYRTGDQVRPLDERVFEFRGRIDDQLKFNGQRVELNEIRAALLEDPRIRNAVVRVSVDEHGAQVMVAYYVARQPIDAAELHEFLAARLIREAVPQLFCHLTRLPLTLNGKVDFTALPVLREIRKRLQPAYTPPRTPDEERIAAIWADVLGVARVGIQDNFFELGGHSLLAARILSRIRDELGYEPPVSRLFEHPTIAEFAADLQTGAVAAVPPVHPVVRDAALPLSFAQERLWFAYQLDPASAAYLVPAVVLEKGAVNVPALEAAMTELVRRHEGLRSTFASIDGQPVCRIGEPAPRAVPIVDLGAIPAAARDELAMRLAQSDAIRPFTLESGPVYRVRVVLLGSSRWLRLFTVSHMVADAWSAGIVSAESGALRSACAAGRPSSLPDLTVQYVDFAVWQRRWLTAPVVERLLTYWRTQLAGVPPAIELAGQRKPALVRSAGAAPPVPRIRGQRRTVRLPAGVSDHVRTFSRAERAAPFMTLLTCFFTLVHLRSRLTDFAVGTDLGGRPRLELEGVVGLFVNQLVLRADLSRDPTFTTMVGRTRQMCLAAYAHQELPFDRLVDGLRGERDLGRNPLFQLMFSFQNTPGGEVRDGDDPARHVHVEKGTAVFDVSLYMAEAGAQFVGWLRYNADLFDAAWAEDFADDFAWIVETALKDPGATLSAIVAAAEDRDHQRRSAREAQAQVAARQRLVVSRRRPLA